MSDILFHLHSWPRAIVHIDGDAFFTSCEEAIYQELRGKPLITGGERGEPTAREKTRLKGETARRHLGLPVIHVKA